jgi:transposase-like protein
VDWYNFCREVCSDILIEDSEINGGPGRVVEIDESKFGKRKYHRGKRVDGCWVFGGIERDSGRCFFEVVEDRSESTLVAIINKYIKKETTIISDCWKAYCNLEKHGYHHQTVNHSTLFKDPITGACTNKIESTWHSLKQSLPKSGTRKELYESYFHEYCVRKKYLRNANDDFLKFLDLIKRVYNPNHINAAENNKENETPLESVPESVNLNVSSSSSSVSLDHSYFDCSMDLFD